MEEIKRTFRGLSWMILFILSQNNSEHSLRFGAKKEKAMQGKALKVKEFLSF
jgi:hypothetical protein